MKKHISVAALVLAISAGSAFAADLPIRKEPVFVPPPILTWTGFYAGLNAGYGWGTENNAPTISGGVLDNPAALVALIPPVLRAGAFVPGGLALANSGIASVNQNGFIGGAQFGYNYQWGSSYVIGIETDIQGSGIRGTGGYTGAFTDSVGILPPIFALRRVAAGAGTIQAGVDFLGTLRGRIGYLFTPTLLAYATGGLAYGGIHESAVHSSFDLVSLSILGLPVAAVGLPTVPGQGNFSDTRVGWTAGGGVEWMFAPNWSLKTEALYYDLGSSTFASSPVIAFSPISIIGLGGIAGGILGGAPQIAHVPFTRVTFQGVIARVGLNYHFNWGAPPPVVAKF